MLILYYTKVVDQTTVTVQYSYLGKFTRLYLVPDSRGEGHTTPAPERIWMQENREVRRKAKAKTTFCCICCNFCPIQMMSYYFLIYFWLAFGMRFNMKKDPLYLANMEWLIRQNTRVCTTDTRVSNGKISNSNPSDKLLSTNRHKMPCLGMK